MADEDGRKDAKRKRQLSAEQINSMSKEDMRQVLLQSAATTMLHPGGAVGEAPEEGDDENEEPPDDTVITQEIWKEVRKLRRERKKDLQEMQSLRADYNELRQECNDLKSILVQQQRFIEQLDNKERECNIIITGLSEDAIDDKIKCDKVKDKIGRDDIEILSHLRLGERRPDAQWGRPILVKVANRAARDSLVKASRALKRQGTEYEKVFIKKDLHPAVRKEWKRLHDVADAEKAKPENRGKEVVLDFKKREVVCDGTVLDRWSPLSYFQ